MNAVHGISGWVAVIGIGVLWLTVACKMGNSPRSAEGVEESQSTVRRDVLYLQTYFAVVYFYAGLAKTNTDWLSGFTPRELLTRWVGEALQSPAGHRTTALPPIFGQVLGRLFVSENVFLQVFAVCGLLLDLLGGWVLMVPVAPLRLLTFVAVVFFNMSNHWLFVIETFPWVMMSSLALYHDASWMIALSRLAQRMRPTFSAGLLPHLAEYISSVWRRGVRPLLMGVFMYYHLLAPLQCGLSSVGDRGAVSWTSTCQNFNWRMMSRSGATVASSLRFQHPVSGETHVATLDMLGRDLCAHSEDLNRQEGSGASCSEQREFLAQTPQFEDRLHKVVLDAVARAQPSGGRYDGHTAERPIVFADVWLEINGPPIQRFVRPHVDLAAEPPFGPMRSWGPLDMLRSALIRPLSPAWLLPRVETFRSMEWLATFRDLVRREEEENDVLLQTAVDVADGHTLRVLFVTDVPSSGACHFFFHRPTVLRLLYGKVVVEGVGAIDPGEELRVEGRVSWRAVDGREECSLDADDEAPALWMIVFRGEIHYFEIQPF
eukprot:gene33584-41442_t